MEALPPPDRLLFYLVPLAALRHGDNQVSIVNRTHGEYAMAHATLTGMELGLYRTPLP
jgi:hypothetical protein